MYYSSNTNNMHNSTSKTLYYFVYTILCFSLGVCFTREWNVFGSMSLDGKISDSIEDQGSPYENKLRSSYNNLTAEHNCYDVFCDNIFEETLYISKFIK